MLLNAAIDWSARCVKIVPDSTCEAEMAQASRAAKAVIFVRMLFHAMRMKLSAATLMLGDNKAHYEIVQQDGASVRTRYYERAVLLVKRAVLLLILEPMLIGTDSMTADIMTKPLERTAFFRHRSVMMNSHSQMRGQLEALMATTNSATKRTISRLCERLW